MVAIGNPFTLRHTLTARLVSATSINSLGIDYQEFIPTDAAINIGKSEARWSTLMAIVVGMNTAIFSKNGGYIGIGFYTN